MTSEEEQKLEEMESCGSGGSPSPAAATRMQALELLDHYWFFYNILSPPPPPLSDHPPKEVIAIQHGELNSSLSETPKPPEQCQARPSRQLSRQSSLPPDIGKPQPANHHEQDAVSITSPTKRSSLAKRKKKLHRSYTSLGDAVPSRTISSSAESSRRQSYKECCESIDKEQIKEGKSYNWEKDQWRDMLLVGARKWKSLTDLEHEELQGFRDLGFVFGSGDELSPVLLKMIPGLRDREVSGSGVARRPYLSEAWFVQRSAPPLFNWHGRKSRKEMKEKLRFWARAVASNVQQEC